MTETLMRDGSLVRDRRLGALIADDPRSNNYPISSILSPAQLEKPVSNSWGVGVWLDQGQRGTCVAHSISHEAIARPVRVPNVTDAVALDLFCRAQQIDPFPGDCSDGQYLGTSLTAGMEAARERGWFEEYRWPQNSEDAISAIGHKGPGVLAIDWYEDMYNPDVNGWICPTGNWMGRHALLVYSVNVEEGYVWLWNSWSRAWGKDGRARLSFVDFGELLNRPSGEMAIPNIRRYGGEL